MILLFVIVPVSPSKTLVGGLASWFEFSAVPNSHYFGATRLKRLAD